MWYFFCRWKGPPKVDLNGYPRMSNPYYRDTQIWRCEFPQGYKMTQSKLTIKNSKLFYMYVALLLQVIQTPRRWRIGGQGGQGRVKGEYLEISKTGSNTQMVVCRGWGVYIHMYVMYIHMFFVTKIRSRPHIDPHILTICGPSKNWEMPFLSIFVTRLSQICSFLAYFKHIPPSKITKKLIFLHISIYTHGPWTHITL